MHIDLRVGEYTRGYVSNTYGFVVHVEFKFRLFRYQFIQAQLTICIILSEEASGISVMVW